MNEHEWVFDTFGDTPSAVLSEIDVKCATDGCKYNENPLPLEIRADMIEEQHGDIDNICQASCDHTAIYLDGEGGVICGDCEKEWSPND